jgi:transcriptional regulator with XRE-family HTH domain
MVKRFGSLLEQKRKAAGLSIGELAQLSGVAAARLQEMEQGHGDLPSFDTCYHLSHALFARSGQIFVLQDLWSALKTDRLRSDIPPAQKAGG